MSRRPRQPSHQGRLTEKRFWDRIQSAARTAEVKGAKFPADSRSKQAARKARAVVRPEHFNQVYLPHYFPLAVADFQRQMYRALEVADELVVEVPRGHGKSTAVTFAYTLHQVACAEVLQAWAEETLWESDPDLAAAIEAELAELHQEMCAAARRRCAEAGEPYTEPPAPELVWDPYIQIGAVTEDLAEEFTTAVKLELERNAALIYDWGELVRDPGVNYADFVAGPSHSQGVRVLAFGMTGGVVGSKHFQWRPTLCIIDDPDKESLTLSSRALRDRQQSTLGAVRYGLHPEHRIMVVGTRRHWDCLTARLINKGEFDGWTRIRYQAIREDGTPLWPERWSLEALLRLRVQDVETFEKEMMNNPPGDGVRLWTSWQTYERGGEVCRAATQAIVILDPSLGKSEKSDWQAIIVQRFADEGPVLQEREELVRLPPRDLMRLFLDIAEEYDAVEILMEAIGFQLLLKVLVEEDPRFARSLPPITTIEGQADSKHVRISTLATASKQGQYLLPSDRSCHRTERQGLDYGERGTKVDALDAAEMGLRRVRHLRRGAGQRGYQGGGRRRDLGEGAREDRADGAGEAGPRRRRGGSGRGRRSGW